MTFYWIFGFVSIATASGILLGLIWAAGKK